MMKNSYITISIIASVSLSLYFYYINYLKINKLKLNGQITEIKEEMLFNGNNEKNYYYNYYFITNDSLKVKITHNINRKSLQTDIKKFHNKKVVYLKDKPKIFMIEEELYMNHYKYYFVTLPIIFMIFSWFFLKKIYTYFFNIR